MATLSLCIFRRRIPAAFKVISRYDHDDHDDDYDDDRNVLRVLLLLLFLDDAEETMEQDRGEISLLPFLMALLNIKL